MASEMGPVDEDTEYPSDLSDYRKSDLEGGRFALIACSKSKNEGRLPAREKYDGDLFAKSREYAERYCDGYAILSGSYGAVAPCEEIDGYDVSVRDRDDLEWCEDVLLRLPWRPIQACSEVHVLAGMDYRGPLEDELDSLDRHGVDVVVPLEGLGIGEQLGVLKDILVEWEHYDPAAVRRAADGGEADGHDLPEEIAGAEEGDEIRVTADDGRVNSEATTIEGRVDSIDVSNDIFEVELRGVTGGGERAIASDRATLFAWTEPSGGWQPTSVQYALEPTEDQDVEKDNLTTEAAAIEPSVATSADGGETQTQLVSDDPGAEHDAIDHDDPESCTAIISGTGKQCGNSLKSNAADRVERLCGTHADSMVKKVIDVDGEPYADLRDQLVDAGMNGSHAYALATLTDDPHELWELATALEDPDVGGKEYLAESLAARAEEMASIPEVDPDDNPLADDNCVAIVENGAMKDEPYRCRTGAYATSLLCGTHKTANDPLTIFDQDDDPDLDRVTVDAAEYLAIEQRGGDLLAVDVDEWEVVRLEGAGDVLEDVDNKTDLSDGAREDDSEDVEDVSELTPEEIPVPPELFSEASEGDRLHVVLDTGAEYEGIVSDRGTGGWRGDRVSLYLDDVLDADGTLAIERRYSGNGLWSEPTARVLDLGADDREKEDRLGVVERAEVLDEDDVPDDVDRELVLDEITALMDHDLDLAMAVDYWATEAAGLMQKEVAERRGVSPQAISENVRRARERLEGSDQR